MIGVLARFRLHRFVHPSFPFRVSDRFHLLFRCPFLHLYRYQFPLLLLVHVDIPLHSPHDSP
jgi:hypothetical protein